MYEIWRLGEASDHNLGLAWTEQGLVMLHKCYLKKGMVYVPTVVNQGTAVYMDVEPVTTIPVVDTRALHQAFANLISKPNTFSQPSVEDARKPFVILKHSGDKNWPSFRRSAKCWVIKQKSGLYKIAGHRTHQGGYWEEDRTNDPIPTRHNRR